MNKKDTQMIKAYNAQQTYIGVSTGAMNNIAKEYTNKQPIISVNTVESSLNIINSLFVNVQITIAGGERNICSIRMKDV